MEELTAEESRKKSRHWRKACVVCGRVQMMRKRQKTCSIIPYGHKCARLSATISTDEKVMRKRMKKATKASIISRHKKAEGKVVGLTPLQAYRLGYERGYDAGYKVNVDKKLKYEYKVRQAAANNRPMP